MLTLWAQVEATCQRQERTQEAGHLSIFSTILVPGVG